jgi:hypothetical protein
MCLEKPGPRCSGHTRTNFQKATAALKEANADLAQKKQEFEAAQSAEAKSALEASEKAHAVAVAELNTATAKYEESKAKRAVAMEAYREAKDEYNASPEGIKKNRQRAVDTRLTDEQREKARKAAIEGNATRNRAKEAYAIQQEIRAHEEMLAQAAEKSAVAAENTPAATTSLTEEEKTFLGYVSDPENAWRVPGLFNLPGDVHPAIQSEIIEKGDVEQLQALAASEKCLPSNLARIAGMEDQWAARRAVNNRMANIETLTAGIHHSNHDVRVQAAQRDLWQERCDKKGMILNDNAHLGREHKREEMVSWGHNLPYETLRELSQDSSSSVRYHVARHPQTSRSIIERLLEDPDIYVRMQAVRRDPTTDALVGY